MRWFVAIVVIAIVVFFGYQSFKTESGQQFAEQTGQAADQAVERVREAFEEMTGVAERATGDAADSVEQAVDQGADTARDAAGQASAALTVGGVDLAQEIGATVSDTTSALEGITDKASAEAALPSLEGAEAQLDDLSGTVEQLPTNAKESLASLLGDMLPEMQDLVNKVEGIEGAREVVGPTLDSIMTTLDGWAQQPA